MPRYKKYNEHVNDHQIDTIKIFEAKGYVLLSENVEDLDKALLQVKDFEPVIYKKDENSNIIGIIERFIG